MLHRLVQAAKTQGSEGRLVAHRVTNRALDQGDPQHLLPVVFSAIFLPPLPEGQQILTGLPRRAASFSGDLSCSKASKVAFTTFSTLALPSDLVRISCTPAASSTARTPPAAITPVPGEAGLSRTTAPPTRASHFMRNGRAREHNCAHSPCERARWLCAWHPARHWLCQCPGQSCHWLSPATTVTRNWKRRPPFTTLATRAISMTRSSYCCSDRLVIPFP